MKVNKINVRLFFLGLLLLVSCFQFPALADEKDLPSPQSPPRLVNDFADVLSPDEENLLEAKLLNYERTTSTQITIVTVRTLDGNAPAQYGVELFNKWNVGNSKKNNGVLVLAAMEDRKMNITTGYGLEGALTDALSGRIIRNEMAPSFKADHYYDGFNKAADAIIAATKGEYKADDEPKKKGKPGIGVGVGLILLIYFILWIINKFGGGGGSGGSYMGRRGNRSFGGGLWGAGLGGFLGGLGGGSSSGGGWGGGSSGGGFGGFGGGSSGGGGASGSW